ncbi:MAG: penicillin acylase family protein [Rehaibacterium terrae]|uniref:penicillin acylase family protein n=1 Tax=Rehaibacterium terrae TaxID=1341696 RepID=UPI00391C385F
MHRWIKRGLLSLLAVAVVLAAAGTLALRGSLAPLDGELALPGLSAPVSVERDALGTVTITARNEADALRALGYVHAQERYFEMDLLRRAAAGELAALFGPLALERDRSARLHRLRQRLRDDLDAVNGDMAAAIAAYAEGVNAGLAALRVRHWPYLLLRARPEPWRVEDSALVAYAMFFDLQDELNTRELALWRLRQHLPAPLYALLAAEGSEWDAPLMGAPRGNPILPGPDEIDLRTLPAPEENGQVRHSEPAAPGSNNWAVAGALTADGRAIVANDMHLGHRAPNIWFRVRLVYPDPRAPAGRVDAAGVSLPGVPGIVVGSNGHVAWGFTNSYGDWLDWVRVTPAGDGSYRTPEGDEAVRVHHETIAVKGRAPVVLEVRETRWGPIVHDDDGSGHALALAWTAHRPGALNLRLLDLVRAGDLDQAVALADHLGIPAQNLLVADRHGRIGWKLAGRIPQRLGDCDPQQPLDPLAGCDWDGWLPQTPHLLDPEHGRLWTANARVADGEALRRIGDAGYANGARQRQIRDALFARERFDEDALLALQLDDRALFLERWHRLLLERAGAQDDDALRRLAEAARDWEGRAAPEAVSYRLVRTWRLAVLDRIAKGLSAPARVALGDDFVMPDLPQLEGVAWELLSQRPAHLLPKRFDRWDALLAEAAAQTIAELEKLGPLEQRRWGERNTARICHPLAGALPGFVRPRLCMPGDELPGDAHMPRVQAPAFGASQRMVVSPGREADGYLHMPGGQSGHPLSPFWGAGHAAWVQGEATPFLPGEARHRLTLTP